MIIGEILWAVVPSSCYKVKICDSTGGGSMALLIIGLTITSMFSGVGMAGTYKWIPQMNKEKAGILGGFTGALGATGGFVWAWIFAGIATGGKSSTSLAYGLG